MSEPADRRTIAELSARYEFEPDLQDVFVEGPNDRALMVLAIGGLRAARSVGVYEIGTVDVPEALLRSRGLEVGDKGRVIVLASELEASSERSLSNSVACLVDTDLDGLLGRRRSSALLVHSTGLSFDALIADLKTLSKVLTVGVLGFPQRADDLWIEMRPVLNERLLHRLACAEMGVAVTPPPIRQCCDYDGTTLTFDSESYISRLLGKAGAVFARDEFTQRLQSFRPAIEADPDTMFHVDDYVELLHFCLHAAKSQAVPNVAQFRRLLLTSLDASDVGSLPEVQEIARRFGIGAPA